MRRGWWLPVLLLVAAAACGPSAPRPLLTLSASALGVEAEVVGQQLARFAEQHPEADVELRVTPDAADQRHQLYVQWLNGRASEPDVLQLDIIWTAEFAAAGWILPLDSFNPEVDDFIGAAIRSNRWEGSLYALPWFVDAGLLYWRTDLLDAAPSTLEELRAQAARLARGSDVRYGLVWQGARYEGLVTVFLEHLAAFGGEILDARGQVVVDEPASIAALSFMREAVGATGVVPPSALTWQEEQVRFAFQNGQAAFMRNWPYAWPLLQDPTQSAVAGRVGVAPFPPAEGGRPAAALGGAQLAVNALSGEPQLAWELVEFLTAPEQMLERARLAAQLPARQSLYEASALAEVLPIPAADVQRALEATVARPVTPVYSELSEILQVHLHRALTGQEEPQPALEAAAAEIRGLFERSGLAGEDGE